jgi:hypothetical protein
MPYRFTQGETNYRDYASGRVFYGRPGHPALPVRLASEVFQRCLALRQVSGSTAPCVLYDPCCGGAYHLVTVAYLHRGDIDVIIGSDLDEEALNLARRNLSLLSLQGLSRRIREIEALLSLHGKASHQQALASAKRLKVQLCQSRPIETRLFQADATNGCAVKQGIEDTYVDIVLTDVPYGRQAIWQGPGPDTPTSENNIWRILDALRQVLSRDAIVAIVADKQQRIHHEAYRRADRFKIGRRQIEILLCR